MCDPPPILDDIDDLLLQYLTPDNLPIHDGKRSRQFWPRKPNAASLFEFETSHLAPTTLKVERDLNTGEIIEFKEVATETDGRTAQNSLKLTRAPTTDDSIWGSVSNYPFWPGGLPDPVEKTPNLETTELLTVPPGFERGYVFDDDDGPVKDETVNLLDVLEQHDFMGIWQAKPAPEPASQNDHPHPTLPEEADFFSNLPVLDIFNVKSKEEIGTEWAILLDTTKPVTDFKKQVPCMAIEFEFELDTFQKLAIIQLEKHNHVFVAAHTSAGKTVVAEYAIALSQRHMTRTIYTSPIKALSNQKYRDFKQKFGDVGLVTGDFQINMKAACLIMTTEILRSMLFGGSEVTRDLEYVIFDEVHYINDKERGHVWEQVLIMLPAHVCVVLLSATVPNTVKFADWLGRTYQKKVYVISTYKRPVPLEHYLYTGSGGSTRDNRFLILDSNGNFLSDGYKKAEASIKIFKEKAAKNSSKNHPKTGVSNFKRTQTMWDGLIAHLLKSNPDDRDGLLPAVTFTFSRQKCDSYAEMLKHLDLTSKDEKFEIRKFFDKCVNGLKPPDRELPQIVRMREILYKGIGVHHSGILPIIKEMIEMLFQKRLVKLLFATETFAMGVNMPARTVLFDSVRKHDGIELRNLNAAEYIQMAGRAGRRGKDKTGTVIILCKGEVPPNQELKVMMQGKPSVLTSQFRITYSLVLSLLRVERLSLEGIISRSFLEADHQKKQVEISQKLGKVECSLSAEHSRELSEYMQPLIRYFKAASDYLSKREMSLPKIVESPHIAKELMPGRVLVITHKHHLNKLALLLSVSTRNVSTPYKVLVLSDAQQFDSSKPDLWYKMLALVQSHVFCPESALRHDVLNVSPLDVFEITSKIIKVDTELVIKDWEKRKIARFKDDLPGNTFSSAVRDLYGLSLSAVEGGGSNLLTYLDFVHDLKLREIELYELQVELDRLKDVLLDCVGSTRIPNFKEQFSVVFAKKSLEAERDYLKYQMSYNSLLLYPELEKRIKLLHRLSYVDDKNRVELKGKVACEMGSNELLITELVVRNELANFKPAEIAALLSSLVFQAKTNLEPQLTEQLQKGKEIIEQIYNEISSLEFLYNFDKDSKITKEPNFGLAKVVYEWASAKPFVEIMCLTDIQEGIIVRCIQQLNETICDVRNAARITGDSQFQSKMEEASAAIKRDIVFAESLYMRNESF